MRTAAFHTLGCKVNAYETEAMEQALVAAGYDIRSFEERADVYIINTCSVTNIADRKSRQMLHRAKSLNPGAVVVAAGCYAQAAAESLKEDGSVDLVLGNQEKKDLVRILEAYFSEDAAPAVHVGDMREAKRYEDLSANRSEEHTRAFLKVQDGCNQYCSYCIIPFLRGNIRSRRPGEVRREAERLAANGVRELVLTGIHLSSYGRDFKNKEERESPGASDPSGQRRGHRADPHRFAGAEDCDTGICSGAFEVKTLLSPLSPLASEREQCDLKAHEPPLYGGGI